VEEDKIKRLVRLLKRLDAGESSSDIRKEQCGFLATIEPKDICLAEQDLIMAGMTIEDMQHMCSRHIQILGDQTNKLRESLPSAHVLRMILCEHDMLKCFLVDLLDVNRTIQEINYITSTSSEFRKLSHIVHHLLAANQHYEREEQIIFPELERRGYFGPLEILRKEHFDLKENVDQLKELVDNCCVMNFAEFRLKLDETANSVVSTSREHIALEDNILYPTALEVVDDESMWSRMKAMCDEIGYCCFRHDF